LSKFSRFGFADACCLLVIYAYFLVPETKGLSLEQVDQMMAEVTPRQSVGWRPTKTFAEQMGMTEGKHVVGDSEHADRKEDMA
jgi:hypothetical protein